MQHDITVICIKNKSDSVPWPLNYHKGYQLLYHQSHPLKKICLLFSGYMQNTFGLAGFNLYSVPGLMVTLQYA